MPDLTTRRLLTMMNARVVGTTDDPTDWLEHHRSIAAQNLAGTFPVKVVPTFRPDKAIAVENPEAFGKYTYNLASTANIDISSFRTFIEALRKQNHEYTVVSEGIIAGVEVREATRIIFLKMLVLCRLMKTKKCFGEMRGGGILLKVLDLIVLNFTLFQPNLHL
jgi:Glucuronate isomerase